MRVELNTIQEFLSELEIEAKAGRIHENIVRVRIDRVAEQDEAITFEIRLWATAAVVADGSDWLMEVGVIIGSTADEGTDPDREAVDWKKRIEKVAEANGLTVRAGKIELY